MKLSVELQLIIFQLCVDKSPMTLGMPIERWPAYKSPVPYSELSPMLLMRVCSYWRRLALSDSSLWTYIRVFVDENRAEVFPPSRCLGLYLQMSADRPIHISFTQIGQCFSRPRALPILHQLFAHSQRWEAVDFRLSSLPDFDTLISSRSVSMLSLKYLVYTPFDQSNAPVQHDNRLQELHRARAFHCGLFPNLQGVRYFSLAPYCPSWMYSVQSTSLHHLQLQTPLPVMDALLLLSHCPSVTTLLLNVYDGDGVELSIRHASMPNLQTISLYSALYSTEGVSLLLNSITAPVLAEIDLRIDNGTRGTVGGRMPCPVSTALIHMLERSYCQASVTSLSLYDLAVPENDAQFVAILHRLPSLRELVIAIHSAPELPCITDGVLRALTIEDASAPLCPFIGFFGFYYHALASSDGALGDMLRSRYTQNDLHLQVAYFTSYQALGRADMAAGDDMVARGLDFQFRCLQTSNEAFPS